MYKTCFKIASILDPVFDIEVIKNAASFLVQKLRIFICIMALLIKVYTGKLTKVLLLSPTLAWFFFFFLEPIFILDPVANLLNLNSLLFSLYHLFFLYF